MKLFSLLAFALPLAATDRFVYLDAETLKLRARLEARGLALGHIVPTTLFLADIRHYAAVNRMYVPFFPVSEPAPCGTSPESTRPPRRQGERDSDHGRHPRRWDALSVGTLGRDADTGAVPAAPREQDRIALRRGRSRLGLAGYTPADLGQLSVYLTAEIDPPDFEAVWREEYGVSTTPALTMVLVRELALGTHVGITGIARK